MSLKNGAAEWIERLRLAAMKAVTEEDMREIFQKLVERAKSGDMRAIDMLDRWLTPPPPAPPLQLKQPAQQIKANTVNVYSGQKKRKLLVDQRKVIEHRNGN